MGYRKKGSLFVNCQHNTLTVNKSQFADKSRVKGVYNFKSGGKTGLKMLITKRWMNRVG